jgi:lipid II:glycine glycyltransferase (peptidoglycan interpeptide bridge formation enzyme)
MHKEVIYEYARMASGYTLTSKIYVSDVLKWNTIEYARKKGFEHFDLSDVELYKTHTDDKKIQNIYRCKSKWGGQPLENHNYRQKFQIRKLTSS